MIREPYTQQEAFDIAAVGMLKQGKKSSGKFKRFPGADPETACLYRGSQGRRCGAGMLIPDELYDKKFEGIDIQGVKSKNKEIESLFENIDYLVGRIQWTHDNVRSTRWFESLISIGLSCNLDTTKVEQTYQEIQSQKKNKRSIN